MATPNEHSDVGLEEAQEEAPEVEDFDPTAPPSWETPEHPADELGEEEPSGTEATGQAGDEELAQTQPPAEHLPEKPPDEHPDNYDWLDLPAEERGNKIQELAQTDPDLLARGLLRQRDYTEETTNLARQRESLEAQQAAVAAQQAAAPAEETAQVPVGVAQWAEEFRNQTGREPTQTDYIDYQVQQQVAQVVQPMQSAQIESQAQQTNAQVAAEYNELTKKYPQATAPEVKDAIADRLIQMAQAGIPISQGAVEQTYFALYGPQLLEQAARGASQARQQQAAGRTATSSVPSGPGGGKATEPYTANLDVIAERLKHDPRFQE